MLYPLSLFLLNMTTRYAIENARNMINSTDIRIKLTISQSYTLLLTVVVDIPSSLIPQIS